MYKLAYSLFALYTIAFLAASPVYGQYTISGNAGTAVVTLRYTDGNSRTAVSDSAGDYSFSVPAGFSGTVTPFKRDFTFSPANITYSNVNLNQSNQNYTATPSITGPTVWNGKNKIVFVKADSADWTSVSNQDQITSSVWITRQHTQGLFNVSAETSYTQYASPSGTEWAEGSIRNYNTLTYTSLDTLTSSNPDWLVGRNLVVHLIADDIYLSVRFLTWRSDADGGGFSYIRSTEQAPPGYLPTVWNGDKRIVFTKTDYADWTDTLNQDRITENVIITRRDQEGIFNIAQESGYSMDLSPVGTEWALGSIDNYNTLSYMDWRTLASSDPANLLGRNVVLHLIDDDIYLSIRFASWTQNANGGGLCYVRSAEPAPPGYVHVPKVWNGPGRVVFVKTDYADWTDTLNQDKITDLVKITRQDQQGIFNVALEPSYYENVSPVGTEWAFGSITNYNTLSYTDWRSLTSGNPPEMVGRSLVVHLLDEDIYLSLRFLSWTENANGGGFSYIRSTASAPEGYAPIVWNDTSRITFTKADYADWTDSLNQDRITGNVWLTRQDQEGIFNIAEEPSYTYDTSPSGTEWAIGSIAHYNKLEYQTWKTLSGGDPPSLIGKRLVLHLIMDDIYLSVRFTSWTQSASGGGFTYIRSVQPALPGYMPRVWNGISRVTFTKADSADWSDTLNQDKITDNVRITRQHTQGIFNITEESGFTSDLSPSGTEWASGSILNYDILQYTNWQALSNGPTWPVGQNFVVHLIDEDIYLSLRFISWDPDLNGGGFSYIRSTESAPEGYVPIVWNDTSRIVFTKGDYADWTDSLNQDRISGNVWLTRQDQQSIFNMAEESQFGQFSPIGTEWAIGSINNWNKLVYKEFILITDWWPPDMLGENMVLHLINDDIYLSIRFLSWTRGNGGGGTNGGGFSYSRSTQPALPGYVPRVWNDPSRVVFTKGDTADYTLESNQDRITEKVWITRQDTSGIFNIVEELGVRPILNDDNCPASPANTEWAFGTTAGYDSLNYKRFLDLCGFNPASLVGKDLVLHLIDDDIFLDIKFLSWPLSGGFSYSRSEHASSVGIKSETQAFLPRVFNLEQNYPNPFNPTTTIGFTLAEDSKVSLKIFDILGREVATLVNGERKAGVLHRAEFDATRFASGVYFYRLDSGKHSMVKKLMLLK